MQLNDLSMSFGTQELFKNINIFIGKNEKVGIVGVNGAGKTTFFKIIMGMIEPDNGKIVLENKYFPVAGSKDSKQVFPPPFIL